MDNLEGNCGGSCDARREGLIPPAGGVLPIESPRLSCQPQKGIA